VDYLRKLCERKVGTHEVEGLASKVIRGQGGRRNPLIVVELLRMKLKDAEEQLVWARKLFERSKTNLYMTINRRGAIKEEFWAKAKLETSKAWVDGKKKNLAKADRLEAIYKGPRSYTGMVGNIRVGDRTRCQL